MLKLLNISIIWRCIVVAGLLIGLTSELPAASIYVSPAGDDSTGDGSQTKPYREIRKGLTIVSPGNTILVADGQYKGFDIDGMAGSVALPITIRAQGTNAVVLLTTDRSDNRDTMFINNSQYIVIDGLRSFNANRAGIRLESSPNITVINCTFGSCSYWGIFTGHCDDLLIASNECYGSVLQHGIYVGNSGDRPVIRGNRSHDNAACGIHMNGDLSCGGDGIISEALVENNIIYNNGAIAGGGGINMDGVQDSIIRNNLLYNNHASGIVTYQGDGTAGPWGQKILHNTIIMAADGRYAVQFSQTTGTNYVRNNILYNLNPNRGGIAYYDGVLDVPNVDSDYNIFPAEAPIIATDDWGTRVTLAQWQQNQGRELHSFVSTQSVLFAGYATNNYHLASNSPAIDKGNELTGFVVTVDRENTPRPQGSGYDIGAYEYSSGPTAPVITSPTSALGNVAMPFSYQITASGSPTNFGASGLPPGLGINTTNGLISGTPTTGGTTIATISAMNFWGSNSVALTISINGGDPIWTGLMGWWKLDESSGTTAADSSGYGNDGTLSGGTWQPSGGQIGGALHLNAFDVVNCGAAPSLNTPSMTVAFWMKPDVLGNMIPVDKLPATGSVGYAVKLRDTGTIWFRVGAEGGPATDVYGGSNIYTNGAWTHVACTFNKLNGAMRMYINGVVESHQPTYAVTLNASSTPFKMGSTVEQYAGLLDDVQVYDHALTSNEIVTVMLGGGSSAEVIRFVPAGMSAGSAGCSFSWSGATDKTNNFQVYRRTNLVAGNWQSVASNITRNGTGTNLWTDTNMFPRAFYRVATPNQ